MTTVSLDSTHLQTLFSAYFAFDGKGILKESSETVRKYLPEAVPGTCIFDLFEFHRPAKIDSMADLRSNFDALLLLIATDGSFALRGQLVVTGRGQNEQYIFLGAPWLSWITGNLPELDLSISDFAKQDAQLDQLFLMTTEQNMVLDLERVNEELKTARDEAESANRARSDFFAVMSHEMRTPLNGVVSAISLLEDSVSDPEQQQLLDIARKSSQDLMLVINYALDSAKAEAGGFKLELEDFDPLETVLSIIDVVQARAKSKDLEVKMEIGSGVPRWVTADSTKIRHVLFNLAGNAVKFTERGNVTISLGFQPDSGRLRFEVTDTGQGIEQSKQSRIFDAFWSSPGRSAGAELGTGLGLDISRRLVSMLSGEIGFNSQPGKGSTFWFELPVEISDSPVPEKKLTQADQAKELPKTYQGRVLLVDDNQTNLTIGKLLLEKFGVRVETVSNGKEAVEMVESVPFDLVLMDITMPVMDGLEATAQIRSNSKYEKLPIVALTAHAVPSDVKRFMDCGMNAYLAKPINRAELANLIDKWLAPAEASLNTKVETPPECDEDKGVCDYDILSNLVTDIGEGDYSSVRNLFLQELEQRERALFIAWGEKNYGNVAHEAHTLSSSTRSFGAIRLADKMKAIESAASAGSQSELSDLLGKLRIEIVEAVDAIKRFGQQAESNG